MVSTEQFVFLHLEKCAGTFITKFLLEAFPGSDYEKGSAPLPFHPANKFVFGSIRNPWDWYVSLYHNTGGVQKKLPKGITFTDFVKNMCSKEGIWHDLDFAKMHQRDIGMLSFRYFNTYKVFPDFICRVEDLKAEIVRCFASFDHPLSLKNKNLLNKMEKVNVGKRGNYRDYYTNETRDLVAHKDRMIINTYQYTF